LQKRRQGGAIAEKEKSKTPHVKPTCGAPGEEKNGRREGLSYRIEKEKSKTPHVKPRCGAPGYRVED